MNNAIARIRILINRIVAISILCIYGAIVVFSPPRPIGCNHCCEESWTCNRITVTSHEHYGVQNQCNSTVCTKAGSLYLQLKCQDPRYRLCLRRIYWWLVDSLHKRPVVRETVFFNFMTSQEYGRSRSTSNSSVASKKRSVSSTRKRCTVTTLIKNIIYLCVYIYIYVEQSHC